MWLSIREKAEGVSTTWTFRDARNEMSRVLKTGSCAYSVSVVVVFKVSDLSGRRTAMQESAGQGQLSRTVGKSGQRFGM